MEDHKAPEIDGTKDDAVSTNPSTSTTNTTAATALGVSKQKSGLKNIYGGPELTEGSAANAFVNTMQELSQRKGDISLERRRVYCQFLMCITKEFRQTIIKSPDALFATRDMLQSAPKKSVPSRIGGIAPATSPARKKSHDCDIAGNILFYLYKSIRAWPPPLLEIYLRDVLAAEQR